MRLLITEIAWDYPEDCSIENPYVLPLDNRASVMILYMGLANGIFCELCVEGDCKYAVDFARGIMGGVGKAKPLSASQKDIQKCWLHRPGYECYIQMSDGYFFLNPRPQPELFKSEDYRAYTRSFVINPAKRAWAAAQMELMVNDRVDLTKEELQDSAILTTILRELRSFPGQQYDIITRAVSSHLALLIKESALDKAKNLLTAFLSIPITFYPPSMRNELGANALCLAIICQDDELTKEVFQKLIPKEVTEKTLAFNLACYYAGKNDKDSLMKYTAVALGLGFEVSRFKDTDFENFADDKDFVELYSRGNGE